MSLQEDLIERVEHLIQKADAVLTNYQPPTTQSLGERWLQQGHSTNIVDSGLFTEWQSQSMTFLVNLLGADHTYVDSFREKVKQGFKEQTQAGQGILRAVKEDLEGGYLKTIRSLVEAELFDDFLDMAKHLHDRGYKDPAASLAGAVLEDGLRKIALANNVPVKPNINSLNQECRNAQAYNQLVWRKIQVWADIRNDADHGNFTEYSADDVSDMIKGVQSFLADYLK